MPFLSSTLNLLTVKILHNKGYTPVDFGHAAQGLTSARGECRGRNGSRLRPGISPGRAQLCSLRGFAGGWLAINRGRGRDRYAERSWRRSRMPPSLLAEWSRRTSCRRRKMLRGWGEFTGCWILRELLRIFGRAILVAVQYSRRLLLEGEAGDSGKIVLQGDVSP